MTARVTFKKTFEVYERSDDGLLKTPNWNEGYGYHSGLYGPFDSEEAAIEALMEKSYDWLSPRDFIIVPVIRVEGNS